MRIRCADANPRTPFGGGSLPLAHPGLISLLDCYRTSGVRSPEGCKNISPGWSVLCDTRGISLSLKERTPTGCEDTDSCLI
jgi:hypothetical protein